MRLQAATALTKPIRANGPCGCTLTVGDQVVVDGLQGRGVIVARDGRDLVVKFRSGEYLKRDQRYVHKIKSDYVSTYSSNRETNLVLNATGEVNIEMERGPLDRPQSGGYIIKRGTLFCVKSHNQLDKDFGCFGSREEAEVHIGVLHGAMAMGSGRFPVTTKLRHIKGPGVKKPNPSGHSTFNMRKPNMSLPRLKADQMGEPMAGNMGNVHMEPNLWFHPPSLSKRNSNESLRIPSDNPGEQNDKFLDKTQRDSKETQDFRMKLLKRSAPGGLPAQIPAHTTLVAPHTASYMPSGITGLYGAARARRAARLGYGMRRGAFTSYRNQGRI